MKRKFYSKILLFLYFSFFVCMQLKSQTSEEKKVVLIPQPSSMIVGSGSFTFTGKTSIAINNEEQDIIARNFASLFTQTAGFTPLIMKQKNGDVCFVEDKKLAPEAYKMKVEADKITITASTSRGFFYALQSIRQLLPPSIEGSSPANDKWSIPVMTIEDEPRFSYRGFMLDVSRFFLPKTDLLRLLDCLSMLKINKLHFHLTDDNGWRLEIKKYPRLTEVGAWRVDRPNLNFSERRNEQQGETATVGGFYTQDDMKEIIRYASQRQIEIIPEIDVPAHSNGALAAYPEYACSVVDKRITVLPGMGIDNTNIIFCAGNDNTYAFLQNILDEIMDVFPSKYINLGGDEAIKDYWKRCPLCQKRIAKEGLKGEEGLQGYFMGRLNDYLRSKGKQMIGWDELTNSKIPEDAIILGWQGYGQAALKAAEQGHRFIMTPARVTYLIRYQGPQWFEPFTYFGNNTLKDVFDYEPVQEDWKPQYEPLLMGVQASLWTEFCNTPEDVFYLVFPRIAALAEIAWVQKGRKDWGLFLEGLDNYNAHIARKGIVYAHSMYNIQHKISPEGGKLSVELECIRPDLEIRYTVDNTAPSSASPLYNSSFVIDKDAVVKAATFIDGKQVGELLILPLKWNLATAKPILTDSEGDVLVNGLRGSLKHTDFEWASNQQGEYSITIDLLEDTVINELTLGCITNYGMGIYKPRSIVAEVSTDNNKYTEVGKLEFTDEEIFKNGTYIENLSISVHNTKTRYVKIIVEKPGICPPDHLRSGQESKVYFDEIIIE